MPAWHDSVVDRNTSQFFLSKLGGVDAEESCCRFETSVLSGVCLRTYPDFLMIDEEV
jgi:hypothetical protein